MRKDIRDKELKSLANSTHGKALFEYLEEKIVDMVDISKNKPASWEEVLGREQAVKLLKDIFRFLGRLKEKKETNIPNQYE